MGQLLRVESIEQKILLIRGYKVLLDRHLAELYGVPTMRLNEAVKRNIRRFPSDFMFQLTEKENEVLISHFAISKGKGGHRKKPNVFTEQGVAMLSGVLQSDRAIDVNIAIMRAFVALRELLSTNKDLFQKLHDLERKYVSHDHQIKAVFDAIRQLMEPPKRKRYRVGF